MVRQRGRGDGGERGVIDGVPRESPELKPWTVASDHGITHVNIVDFDYSNHNTTTVPILTVWANI